VTSALIGASSVKQLEQNHAAINGQPLTQSELSEIDLLAKPGLV
jgi:L-glyceraldehyde 3-phosphate reductase